MSFRGGSGGTRRLSRGLPPRRLRRLVHERQRLLGQVQAHTELAREFAWQGRRFLMKLEGESAVELNPLPQGGVGPHPHFEGAPLVAWKAAVEEEIHGLEQRRLEGTVALTQAGPRLEQARVHDVRRHVEHLADGLVLEPPCGPKHQDGARHRVEPRQRPPQGGMLPRRAGRPPAGRTAGDPQSGAASRLLHSFPPEGNQAAVKVDTRLPVARWEVGRQKAADQALLGQLGGLRRVAGQVIGQDEQPATVALDDVVAVGGIRPQIHQVFFGPFPDVLPIAR